MKALKILFFFLLLSLSIYLFDLLFLYALDTSSRLSFWGKFLLFFPALSLAFYLPVYIIGWIASLNPYRWLVYLALTPILLIWVGFNTYNLWTIKGAYSTSLIFEASYFTIMLLIALVAGLIAPIKFEDDHN